MKKKILILIVLIGLAVLTSCKKENINPKIKIELINTTNDIRRLEIYVGQNFSFNEPFFGGKILEIEATEKEYDVYFVYYAMAQYNDKIRFIGLNTDTTIQLTANKSYKLKIK